jgi:phosphofructokinase-like protein
MRIGVLTGGGDCPGLNAAIRAIVVRGEELGHVIIGIQDGWKGLLEARGKRLTRDEVDAAFKEGGTMLFSSRTNPYKKDDGERLAMKGFEKLGIDALIPIGGEDTLGVASRLTKAGMPCVAVPKTIDNDLSATDVTIGFNTAVSIAMDAIDRLHTTTRSHHRVSVVEVMGRHAGWMTYIAGLAGGAHVVLIPEEKFDIEEVCEVIKGRKDRGKGYSVVAVAEGALPKDAEGFITKSKDVDEFGHVLLGGIGNALAKEIEKRTGITARATVLGHTQRGGRPSVFDRVLGLKLGYRAVEAVHNKDFGKMIALKGNDAVPVALDDAVGQLKVVSKKEYDMAKSFFG